VLNLPRTRRAVFPVGAFLLWCALTLAPGCAAWADAAVPPLKARVTDLTRSLTPNQLDTLEQLLKNFETQKGSQIAVLIVPTTQPEDIAAYSIRVVDNWKLGRKGVDDGVLLLVAKDDRALRIEVGRGLEGVLPDAVTRRIIDEIIVPFFKQGDMYGRLQAGIVRMIRVVEGEPLPPPAARDVAWSGYADYLPGVLVAVLVFAGVMRAIFGRLIGAGLAAGLGGFVFWFVSGTLLGALVIGVIVFVFVLAGGGSGLGYRGYGGGGGGISGGGFSGGGGGFGGGGASGRW
jgi:uncharacterized protein